MLYKFCGLLHVSHIRKIGCVENSYLNLNISALQGESNSSKCVLGKVFVCLLISIVIQTVNNNQHYFTFNILALIATTIVLTAIKAAPIAGLNKIPQ